MTDYSLQSTYSRHLSLCCYTNYRSILLQMFC